MYCDNKSYKINVILVMHDIYNCKIHAAHTLLKDVGMKPKHEETKEAVKNGRG